MRYRRMPIEVESPEQLGYGRIRHNLAESSVTDATLGELGVATWAGWCCSTGITSACRSYGPRSPPTGLASSLMTCSSRRAP